MLRKLLKLTGFLLLVGFLIITLAFTSNESKNITCRNIEIEYNKKDIIQINKKEILQIISDADDQLIGKNMEQINSEFIEKAVEEHQAILKAEIYKVVATDSTSYKGILAVKIKHRKPVVRAISESGSYYLDEVGGKIPVSKDYTANVLVVTGNFNEEFAVNQLLPFVLFIENNEFWKAQIEQVHIERNGDVILSPLVGNHLIEMGKIDGYQEKLRNMKAFYGQVLAKNNWNIYESISLKYTDQVIAKKR